MLFVKSLRPMAIPAAVLDLNLLRLLVLVSGRLLGQSTTPKSTLLSLPKRQWISLLGICSASYNWWSEAGVGWFVSKTSWEACGMVKECSGSAGNWMYRALAAFAAACCIESAFSCLFTETIIPIGNANPRVSCVFRHPVVSGRLLGQSTTPKSALLSLPKRQWISLLGICSASYNWWSEAGVSWFVSKTSWEAWCVVK